VMSIVSPVPKAFRVQVKKAEVASIPNVVTIREEKSWCLIEIILISWF
jgi:hypothetical protein